MERRSEGPVPLGPAREQPKQPLQQSWFPSCQNALANFQTKRNRQTALSTDARARLRLRSRPGTITRLDARDQAPLRIDAEPLQGSDAIFDIGILSERLAKVGDGCFAPSQRFENMAARIESVGIVRPQL